MTISASFLLYALAIFLLIYWLPAIFAPKAFTSSMERILKNPDMVRMISIWTMIIALLFLANYWKLDWTWNMLIAILWWLSLLKWVVLLWFPWFSYSKFKFFRLKKPSVIFLWIIMIVFAFLLSYWGMKFL